jgi:hypothetical protein
MRKPGHPTDWQVPRTRKGQQLPALEAELNAENYACTPQWPKCVDSDGNAAMPCWQQSGPRNLPVAEQMSHLRHVLKRTVALVLHIGGPHGVAAA